MPPRCIQWPILGPIDILAVRFTRAVLEVESRPHLRLSVQISVRGWVAHPPVSHQDMPVHTFLELICDSRVRIHDLECLVR